ncbi:MAG: pyridoxamine 5'-phosphate oxidase [Actinomycetes bacterium]
MEAHPGLTEAELTGDPLDLFARWFEDVVAAGLPEPTAMVLATVGADGWPQGRTVLLKGYDAQGLRFFTNTTSVKATALAAVQRAALVFPWHAIHRQVRVSGHVRKVPVEEASAYFATRPRDSQLGAWASPQSSVVASREELGRLVEQAAARFPEGTPVPLPPHWGGYRVVPVEWEFWAGRAGRLHDRLRYRRTEPGSPWRVERLAP